MAVLHHNFIRSSSNDSENLKDADEVLPIFLKNNVQLILHGHQHIANDFFIGKADKLILVLATGSAGLDNDFLPENSRRYQLINIDNNQCKVFRRRYDEKHVDEYGKGCWVADILPNEDKIYSTYSLKTYKDHTEKKQAYDYLKLDIPIADIRGKEILILAYPKRKIELVDQVFDHKKRIYYEYFKVELDLNIEIYFLFVGKKLNATQTFKHFLENNELPPLGLTICTPHVISKKTGDKVERAENISENFKKQLNIISKRHDYKYNVIYIDDYIWENCLDLSFRKDKFIVPVISYFIDQNLYYLSKENETHKLINKGLSIQFFQEKFQREAYAKYSNPISIILASGGMGKTTLCDYLANMINQLDKKKSIYIICNELLSKLDNPNIEIRNINDLFSAYATTNKSLYNSLLEPNNLELNVSCGNIIIIIDGLDELESALAERFHLNSFLDSIIEIDKYFGCCNLIITSRDFHENKYLKKEGLDIYYLKGFENKHVEQYFTKRFQNRREVVRSAIDFVKNTNIKIQDHYMPLFLNLIGDIIEREDGSPAESLSLSNDYLNSQEPFDYLILRLIEREIDKQNLGISINQFIELLFDIVVEHHGKMSLNNFKDYVDICLPCSDIECTKDELYTKYYINPLLKIEDNFIKIKYDALISLLRIRYLQNCLRRKQFNTHIVPILAEGYKGQSFFIQELSRSDNPEIPEFDSVQSLLSFLITELKSTKRPQDIEQVRQAISSVLYLAFSVFKTYDKKDRTDLLLKLYNSDANSIRYLFIYGTFYPLDFSQITVHDSKFDGFTNLFLSDFPSKKTVFYYSIFKGTDTEEGFKIPKHVFDSTCNLTSGLLNTIDTHEKEKSRIFILLKNDIRKFFRSFVESNSFRKKSLNKITSSFSSRLSRKDFLEACLKENIILRETIKHKDIFVVSNKYYSSILQLLNQNNLDGKLEKFCHKLMKKFYPKVYAESGSRGSFSPGPTPPSKRVRTRRFPEATEP